MTKFCKPGVCWFKLNILLCFLATSTCLGIYMYFGGPPPLGIVDMGMKVVYVSSLASIVVSFICIISLSNDSKITCIIVFCNIGLVFVFLSSVYARYCLHEVQMKPSSMYEYSQAYFKANGEPPPFLDNIQRQMHCCGIFGVSDYLELFEPEPANEHNEENNNNVKLELVNGVTNKFEKFVPDSISKMIKDDLFYYDKDEQDPEQVADTSSTPLLPKISKAIPMIPHSCCASSAFSSEINCGLVDLNFGTKPKPQLKPKPVADSTDNTDVQNSDIDKHGKDKKVRGQQTRRDRAFSFIDNFIRRGKIDVDHHDDDEDEDDNDNDDDDEQEIFRLRQKHGQDDDEEKEDGVTANSNNGRASKLMKNIGIKFKYFLNKVIPEAVGSSAFNKHDDDDDLHLVKDNDNNDDDDNERKWSKRNDPKQNLDLDGKENLQSVELNVGETDDKMEGNNQSSLVYQRGCGKNFDSLKAFVDGFPKESREGAASLSWLVLPVEMKDLYLRFITVYNFILMFVFNYYVIRARIHRRNRPAVIPRGPPNVPENNNNNTNPNIISDGSGDPRAERETQRRQRSLFPQPDGSMDIININVSRSRPRRRSDDAELIHPFMLSAMAMAMGAGQTPEQPQLILRNPNSPQAQNFVRAIDPPAGQVGPYNTVRVEPTIFQDIVNGNRIGEARAGPVLPTLHQLNQGQNHGNGQSSNSDDYSPSAPPPPPPYSSIVTPLSNNKPWC